MFQTEIESSTPVFSDMSLGVSEEGRQGNFGWARRALFLYNPAQNFIPRVMLTESDTYIVFSATHLFVFEIINSGWMCSILVTALSIREKKIFTKIINFHPYFSSFPLPQGSESGSIRIRRAGIQAHFITMEQGNRIIKVDIPHFGRDNTLRGELVLTMQDDAQSIVTNLPWPHERARFQYTRCSPWFFAEGIIQFENKEIVFSKGLSWGIFLWKRIARPRHDTHYWAAASGISGGRHISFSLGYGSVDTAYATENAFFINSRLHKLDFVTFKSSTVSWLQPWHFTSSDGRLSMRFNPLEMDGQRYASIRHSASIDRVFGVFSGVFSSEDNRPIEFNDITGVIERGKTRK